MASDIQILCHIHFIARENRERNCQGKVWVILILMIVLSAEIYFLSWSFFVRTAVPFGVAGLNTLLDESWCSPSSNHSQSMQFRAQNPFYTALQSREISQTPLIFYGDAKSLCENDEHSIKDCQWNACLPIYGNRDIKSCSNQNRSSLLHLDPLELPCITSMVDLLLIEVYDEIKYLDLRPMLLYGTLLGAFRDRALSPLKQDGDLGFHAQNNASLIDLRSNLAERGYHMFFNDTWNVCIAPTHPLASALYHLRMEPLQAPNDHLPYLNLFEMRHVNSSTWYIEDAKPTPFMTTDQIEPLSKVELNGMFYDTIAHPAVLFKRHFGQRQRLRGNSPKQT